MGFLLILNISILIVLIFTTPIYIVDKETKTNKKNLMVHPKIKDCTIWYCGTNSFPECIKPFINPGEGVPFNNAHPPLMTDKNKGITMAQSQTNLYKYTCSFPVMIDISGDCSKVKSEIPFYIQDNGGETGCLTQSDYDNCAKNCEQDDCKKWAECAGHCADNIFHNTCSYSLSRSKQWLRYKKNEWAEDTTIEIDTTIGVSKKEINTIQQTAKIEIGAEGFGMSAKASYELQLTDTTEKDWSETTKTTIKETFQGGIEYSFWQVVDHYQVNRQIFNSVGSKNIVEWQANIEITYQDKWVIKKDNKK